jgi:2-polyprenyl-3-methyl-5-hydroxy-6-metoxy-1,4-benzoquinol methylase
MICPFDMLLNLIPGHQRVLDIGCGIGTFLQLLAEYRAPQSLAGIEIDASLIETSRNVLRQSRFSEPARLEPYDGVNLPEWIRDYKYVFLVDVLHHIPRSLHGPFLSGLFDRLQSGTTLIIKDMNADQRFLVLFNKMHDLLISRTTTHERGLTQVRQTLSHMGFRLRTVMTQRLYVYPHFTIVCEKP